MDEARLVDAAVAAVWPEVEQQLGFADFAALESAVLIHLRRIESLVDQSGSDVDSAVEELFSAFEPYKAIKRRLIDELEMQALLGERDGTVAGDAGSEARPPLRQLEMPVFFGTDRLQERGSGYGGYRGALSYGGARVRIPDDHRLGDQGKPRNWRLRFAGRRDRESPLEQITPPGDYFDRLAKEVRDVERPEILIFIHGYNVDFISAVYRTARLARDIQFLGVPVLFSWPSRGSVKSYIEDGQNAEVSAQHFGAFLTEILQSTSVDKVHIVAHSMGNRALIHALKDLDLSSLSGDAGRLGEVVFAAPDVDAEFFVQSARHFAGKAGRFTLYVSAKDKALVGSRTLAGYPRAGGGPIVIEGIDTIDASPLKTGIMSHSYFSDNVALLGDLHALIRNGTPPEHRFGLQKRQHINGHSWFFGPQNH